jgi:hypothetical protein
MEMNEPIEPPAIEPEKSSLTEQGGRVFKSILWWMLPLGIREFIFPERYAKDLGDGVQTLFGSKEKDR